MTDKQADVNVAVTQTSATSPIDKEVISNNNNNNTKPLQVSAGANDEDPKIIEVHGVSEDQSGTQYSIEKMGNYLTTTEEDGNQNNDQSAPLTQSEGGNQGTTEEAGNQISDQSTALTQSEGGHQVTTEEAGNQNSDQSVPLTQSESGNVLNESADNKQEDQSKDEETKDLDEADGNVTYVKLDNDSNGANTEHGRELTKQGDNDTDSIVQEPNGTTDVNKPDNSKADTGVKKDLIKKKSEQIIIENVGKDDVDAASTFSLFMDRKDFRYYFQHPYLRLLFAYLVVFFNFLIYAEDPVAHSRKECLIPMIGNDFSFITNRYPPNAWSLLKVIFWVTGLVIGLFVGKLLVHGFLMNKLFRLKMFSDDQGSWMVMFLCSLITIFIMSLIYNLFLMIGGDATEKYRISDLMGVSNDIFMKAAACGTWCGDFFTAWMVTDIMLQEKLYPNWAKPVRKWWKKGYNRIILFWIVVVISSFVVIFVIATDYIQWDKLNRDFMPTNELSRAFLASFILVMDLCIVMQDWDFPHFISAIDIKLPGLNTAHIRFQIPKCLKRESWNVHITGKWFNYGVLFLVMLLDLNMWKNQIFYAPYDYGQYTGPEDRIYTVQDDYSLENFNESLTTYDFRSVTINPDTNQTYLSGDTHMNTKYLNVSLGVKAIAFVPSISGFIIFGVLIWLFGRFKPTENDPYAGRLKKRIRKRFSFRMPWKRKEEVRRKIHAVPKLLYFKRKGASGRDAEPTEIPTKAFTSDTEEKQGDNEA